MRKDSRTFAATALLFLVGCGDGGGSDEAVGIRAQPAVSWGTEQKLTSAGSDVWSHDIAASGSTVHLVWGPGGTINYRPSTHEGQSWTGDTYLASGWVHPTDMLVAQGSNVWLLYLSDIRYAYDSCCERRLGNLYLLRSQNGGVSFEAPKQLTTGSNAFRISMVAS